MRPTCASVCSRNPAYTSIIRAYRRCSSEASESHAEIQARMLEDFGYALGFSHVASGPLVRSSYHADRSAKEAGVAA